MPFELAVQAFTAKAKKPSEENLNKQNKDRMPASFDCLLKAWL